MANDKSLQWKWVGLSALTMFIVQGVLSFVFGIFGIVTLGIGFVLFLILKPVTYFIGGYITGVMSPGITIIEPAIGAVLITALGIVFDHNRLFGDKLLSLVLSGVVACAVAIFGAYLGEKKQNN